LVLYFGRFLHNFYLAESEDFILKQLSIVASNDAAHHQQANEGKTFKEGEAMESCDHQGICRPLLAATSIRSVLLSRIRRSYHLSALMLLVDGIRSFVPHMIWTQRMYKAKRQRANCNADATLLWESGVPQQGGHSYKHAHTQYMRHAKSRYPFLSLFEWLLLSHAWQAGSEWDNRKKGEGNK
jgi:hypothetical protein